MVNTNTHIKSVLIVAKYVRAGLFRIKVESIQKNAAHSLYSKSVT